MNDQDRRAVENMARCGMGLEALCLSFPSFPKEEIAAIHEAVLKEAENCVEQEIEIKLNCS